MVKSHYKGVSAVMFFYSIERHDSFEKLAVWVREVKENVHEETVFFLIGTKLDLDDGRKVTKEEGDSYSKAISAVFFQEISSKTGENVKEVNLLRFSCLIKCQKLSLKSINPQRPSRS